jgi:hypothetical protein
VELKSGHGHILDSFGVEAQDTEVVYGVAVNGVYVALSYRQLGRGNGTVGKYLLVVVEDAVADEGTCTNHVL